MRRPGRPSATSYTQLSLTFTPTTLQRADLPPRLVRPGHLPRRRHQPAGRRRRQPAPQVPGAPGNLRVTGTTSSSISLAWNTSTGTVTGYRVYDGSTVAGDRRAAPPPPSAGSGPTRPTPTPCGPTTRSASRRQSNSVTATTGGGTGCAERAGQLPRDRHDQHLDLAGVERVHGHGHRLPRLRGLHRTGDR